MAAGHLRRRTDSYVVTVGAAVLPDTESGRASGDRPGRGTLSAVHTVPVAGTPLRFTDKRRSCPGEVSAALTFCPLTVGLPDTRQGAGHGGHYTDSE